MLLDIINYIKSIILSRSFLLFCMGFFLAITAFSHYIFGNDNLLEQFGEWVVFSLTGKIVDWTPQDGQVSIIDVIAVIVEAVKDANK